MTPVDNFCLWNRNSIKERPFWIFLIFHFVTPFEQIFYARHFVSQGVFTILFKPIDPSRDSSNVATFHIALWGVVA